MFTLSSHHSPVFFCRYKVCSISQAEPDCVFDWFIVAQSLRFVPLTWTTGIYFKAYPLQSCVYDQSGTMSLRQSGVASCDINLIGIAGSSYMIHVLVQAFVAFKI